jgi:hypothetical protein
MDINVKHHGEDFMVQPMRGRLRSLADIAAELHDTEPNTYAAILLDAKYRFIEQGVSENENGSETWFYNTIDRIAERTRAAVILIHHASKGDQSGKKITDIGAGAGAQSRATDCHLVIRPHEEPDVAVIEAVVRSFAPVDPLPIAWEFPLWRPTFGVDPGKLKGRLGRNEQRQQEKDQEGMEATLNAIQNEPATASILRATTGFGKVRQENLLNKLCAEGKVAFREVTKRGNSCREYYIKN